MIGKLGEDKKVDWPGHMAGIVHTHNSTQSAMMGYSPHYLMFGQQAKAPGWLLLPNLYKCTEVPKRGTSTKLCG